MTTLDRSPRSRVTFSTGGRVASPTTRPAPPTRAPTAANLSKSRRGAGVGSSLPPRSGVVAGDFDDASAAMIDFCAVAPESPAKMPNVWRETPPTPAQPRHDVG